MPRSAAERAFREAVCIVIARGEYPGPAAIQKQLGRYRAGTSSARNLNGKQCLWRERLLEELGWEWVPNHEEFYTVLFAVGGSVSVRPYRRWKRPEFCPKCGRRPGVSCVCGVPFKDRIKGVAVNYAGWSETRGPRS